MTLDAKILKTLREAGSGYVSGADIASRLNISRAAVWARIEELRKLGFDIEATPHLGYRLKSSPDSLYADDIMSRLKQINIIGREIHIFKKTTSTNDIVEKMAVDGVGEGVVVFAESQTRGRGRLGRQWHSQSGKGLWFSVLLRPRLRPQCAMQLTIAAGVSVCRVLKNRLNLPAQIKWPNDIIIQGKKVAGILNEISAEMDRIHYVILGIGLNVNHTKSDFPLDLREIATSLRVEGGQIYDRAELAAILLEELDYDYNKVITGNFTQVSDEWTRNCTTVGKNVTIRVGDRTIEGRAEALDEDGALIVRKSLGHLERIVGGDVTVEKS